MQPHAYDMVLQWKQDARPKCVAVNLGLSQRTKYRRLQQKKEMQQSAQGCLQITNWFPKINNGGMDSLELIDDAVVAVRNQTPELPVPTAQETIDNALRVLHPLTALVSNQRVEKRLKNISTYDVVLFRAIKNSLK